ncbi:MAG: zinc ABC transporter solute-binding protein [Rhodospirillaceae bacterium]|jgi:zinc transport system substrate-binding protein|nr:zinc ABC transporter solute-binding protein [Rhodospirillaceae bacterium]MBT5373433.1 zinc ABC transporter solute-binding protein [Rhodospirillaceae bacterium]MBT5659283.1 zinc ABC transporter solute-binding protein [Rhodospirillaceae bacterium]MBT5752631.1 zinc ABC transporter solute-binding protein [Rhodospirillaceae bacterium]
MRITPQISTILAGIFLVLCGALSSAAANTGDGATTTPKVVVTILPLHSLVSGVMAGATGGTSEPVLLLPATASPHTAALRPSQAQALAKADVIFWMGEDLETFLARPIKNLGTNALVVSMLGDKEEAEGKMEEDEADHGDEHDHGDENSHIWLDPIKAAEMVAKIAGTLALVDPTNAALYQANAAKMQQRLKALDRELEALTIPVRNRPYIVFHDAYGPFEARYGLTRAGIVALTPARPPGAAHVLSIRRRIKDENIACFFREPQFNPALLERILEDSEVKTATLDPLGVDLTPGRQAYFTLMRNLGRDLRSCLEP